jgi:hypothetical protein
MDSIKIKAKNNWDFTLYQVNQEEILSVVFFNSMFDFSRSFKLNEIERNFDFEKLKELSEKIRNNYDLFKDREVIPAIISESPT